MNYGRVVNDAAVLCYVEGCRAYFTTRELSKQWGDDWNDAPYEHNAERPYGPSVRYFADGREEKQGDDWNPDGSPKWWVFFVFFDANYETPAERANSGNSQYSVQDINSGEVAWLSPCRWNSKPGTLKPIQAGTTYADFKRIVAEGGGCVYEPVVTT